MPPAPGLDTLRERGVPTVSDGASAGSVDELEDRRRRLRDVVETDARDWPGTDDG